MTAHHTHHSERARHAIEQHVRELVGPLRPRQQQHNNEDRVPRAEGLRRIIPAPVNENDDRLCSSQGMRQPWLSALSMSATAGVPTETGDTAFATVEASEMAHDDVEVQSMYQMRTSASCAHRNRMCSQTAHTSHSCTVSMQPAAGT